MHQSDLSSSGSEQLVAKQFCSCTSLQLCSFSVKNVFKGFDDKRLVQFTRLVDCCLINGVGFDRFFLDYVDAEGKNVYWNPFWRYGSRYTPTELFMLLGGKGFGFVPEAAVNIFWQLREQYLIDGN